MILFDRNFPAAAQTACSRLLQELGVPNAPCFETSKAAFDWLCREHLR